MAHAIGIDVGTTNVKVVLASAKGEPAAAAAHAPETRRGAGGVAGCG